MKILLSLLALPFLYGASFFVGTPNPVAVDRDGVYICDEEGVEIVESLIITGSRTTPVVIYDNEFSACSYSELLHNIQFGKDRFRATGEITGGEFVEMWGSDGIQTQDGRFWARDPVRSDSAGILTTKFLAGRDEAVKFYDKFRAALKSADTTALLAMCQFPIKNRGSVINASETETDDLIREGISRVNFLQYFDQMFSPVHRKVLLKAEVKRRIGTADFLVRLSEDYHSFLWFRKINGEYRIVQMGACPG